MPALVADIAAGTRPAQIEQWSDAAIKARYPNARDGSEDPAEGLYDDSAHAQAALVQRAGLIGAERRRFKVTVGETWWPALGGGLPTVRLVDPDQALDADGIVTRIEVNLETETTALEVFV